MVIKGNWKIGTEINAFNKILQKLQVLEEMKLPSKEIRVELELKKISLLKFVDEIRKDINDA